MYKGIIDKKHRRNLIILFIICNIIYMVITFNFSTSKYIGKITAEDDILAVPILTLSNNEQTFLLTDMLPGDEKEYIFNVSNSEETKTNEIPLTYYFKVNLETEIPLQINIYDITDSNNGEVLLQMEDNITEKMQMNIVKNEEDKIVKQYKIKILWDKKDNNCEYAGQEIKCNITLEGVQT